MGFVEFDKDKGCMEKSISGPVAILYLAGMQ